MKEVSLNKGNNDSFMYSLGEESLRTEFSCNCLNFSKTQCQMVLVRFQPTALLDVDIIS